MRLMLKNILFWDLFFLILSSLFVCININAAPPCAPRVIIDQLIGQEKLINPHLEKVLAGDRSLYYYSGIGSSYGEDALQRTKEYLDLGARLSPKGWNTFVKIKPLLMRTHSDKEIAHILVDYLSVSTLKRAGALDELVLKLGNKQAAKIIYDEVVAINLDLEIFKKNTRDVFKIFNDVDSQIQKIRNTPEFRLVIREVNSVKKNKAVKEYQKLYEKIFRERWGDSFGYARKEDISLWKKQINTLSKQPPISKLSDDAFSIINHQVERYTAGKFYSNYGGLYNNRDRSLVWYAAGPENFSRESFGSIQEFFAKDGITFEFKKDTASKIYWDEILSMDRKLEKEDVIRNKLTYDTISLSGNKFPEDINRVYASTKLKLNKVKALFINSIGQEKIDKLGISFHLSKSQKSNYISDVNEITHKYLGTPKFPEVNPYAVGNKTYFLSSDEAETINSLERPLFHYIALDGNNRGADQLLGLINQHADVVNVSPVSGTVYKGGHYVNKLKNDNPVYLNPIEEMRTFINCSTHWRNINYISVLIY